MNTMQSSFKNYILSTKTVDSDSEKWAQIQYKTYRFIDFTKVKSRTLVDFSLLKSGKHIELVNFSKLKSSKPIKLSNFSKLKSYKHIELIDFSPLKSYKSIKLPDFSVLKSRALVGFSTVSLYQTKVQLPTGLWDFTRLKCYSVSTVMLYQTKVLHASRIPGSACIGSIWGAYKALASWNFRAGKLEAASWATSWQAGN